MRIAAILFLILSGCAQHARPDAARAFVVTIQADAARLPSPADVKHTVNGLSNMLPSEYRVHVAPIGTGRYLVAVRTYRSMLPAPGDVARAIATTAEQSQGGYVVTVQ